MKNRFISLFLALAMVFVSLTPVMADDDFKPSPSNQGVVSPNQTEMGSIKFVPKDEGDGIYFGKTNKSADDAKKAIDSKSSVIGTSYSLVDMFELEDYRSSKTEFNLALNVAGAKVGDTYYCVHDASSEVEVLNCFVKEDGIVLVKNIKSCSPFYLVKVATSNNSDNNTNTSTDSSSASTSKVVTCEDENGKGWVWSESKKACVYKVTNTGAK